jgi:hypothetical protein
MAENSREILNNDSEICELAVHDSGLQPDVRVGVYLCLQRERRRQMTSVDALIATSNCGSSEHQSRPIAASFAGARDLFVRYILGLRYGRISGAAMRVARLPFCILMMNYTATAPRSHQSFRTTANFEVIVGVYSLSFYFAARGGSGDF